MNWFVAWQRATSHWISQPQVTACHRFRPRIMTFVSADLRDKAVWWISPTNWIDNSLHDPTINLPSTWFILLVIVAAVEIARFVKFPAFSTFLCNQGSGLATRQATPLVYSGGMTTTTSHPFSQT